jgi:predicted amidohydrolase YtcJ
MLGCGDSARTPSDGGATPGLDPVDLLLVNGKIGPVADRGPSFADSLAVRGGRIAAVGGRAELERLRGASTRTIDLAGRTAIPGLNDSHIHPIRGGLNYNLELRWDGVSSLSEALERLRVQAKNTPPPQWVRVVGGWSEFQFREGRMPTLDEINEAAPDTPVFILHLYDQALLNRAALRVLGYDSDPPEFDRGLVQRDEKGRPTGLLVAKPSALILYQTLSGGPKLSPEDQANSSRHFMRELNRLGVTSAIDAGGGGQSYPDDYQVIQELAERGLTTVRLGYDLFAQRAGHELDDFRRWVGMTKPGDGSDMLRMLGAGENLTWAAADFENFLEPRPELGQDMEAQLEPIVRLLAAERWPFRIHATYDESIDRFLGVFERVNGRQPFATRFIIDHAETVSPRNIERIGALGGGIAIQHRMAFQGEYFVHRYGAEAARATPPVAEMLRQGVPVGAGTDATRVASYDPWVALHWLTTGQTLGGMPLYDEENVLDREDALRLWTHGSAWFSGEADRKGTLAPGMYADLAVLSADYITVPPAEIRRIHSVLTMVGGNVVHGDDEFASLAPPLPPASPDWSPVRAEPSPGQRDVAALAPLHHARSCHEGCANSCSLHGHDHAIAWQTPIPARDLTSFWGALGCSCFAV